MRRDPSIRCPKCGGPSGHTPQTIEDAERWHPVKRIVCSTCQEISDLAPCLAAAGASREGGPSRAAVR